MLNCELTPTTCDIFLQGIPIFVLKIDCPCTDFALLWSESGKCVELTSPESLDQLLCELMHVSRRVIFLLAFYFVSTDVE